jgi:Histidinol-phosphate/aromatic aminotransferase and cobyric acid decarboxylase
MVFLCSPNNPTGTMLDVGLIRSLCESLRGFVIVDEAYIEFSDFPSLWPLLKRYPNLILLRTFSKAWGLAGLRCGLILANPVLIQAFRYVQLPFGVSTFAQDKVKERLEHSEEVFLSWEHIKKNRDSMCEQLSNLKMVQKVFKSEANFILVVLKNFEETLALLQQEGIFVLNCSASLPNSIRVSVGTKEQNGLFLKVMETASSLG